LNWILLVWLLASVFLHAALLTRMARLLEKSSGDPELVKGLHQLAFSGDGEDGQPYRKAIAYVYCRKHAESENQKLRWLGDAVLLLTTATVVPCIVAIVRHGG
jgi:hypothetical protein